MKRLTVHGFMYTVGENPQYAIDKKIVETMTETFTLIPTCKTL